MSIVALDTNILAYSEAVERVAGDAAKILATRRLIAALMVDFTQIRIPAQVLAELHHVLRRKALYDASEAHARIARYQDTIAIIPTDSSVLTAACDLASRHNLPTYDAIILAAAAQAECDTLYSEDMQHGFEWRGVRIVNPFA